MEMPSLRNRAKLEQPLLEQALGRLEESGSLQIRNDKVRRSSFEIKISPEENQAKKDLEKLLHQTRFATPRKAELPEQLPHKNERLEKVLKLLIDEGTILLLKDDVLLHYENLKEAIDLITKTITESGAIEAAQVRDLIGTTRKYVIPLLEHLDKIGITRRVENRRVLK
jgi:selenocysteine-specific elongation factor